MCRVLDLNIGKATLLEDLSPMLSIADVKKRMFKLHGIAFYTQSYFSTRGVPLMNDRTLRYYGIASGDTIHMRISDGHQSEIYFLVSVLVSFVCVPLNLVRFLHT